MTLRTTPRRGSANLEIVIATVVCLGLAAGAYAIVRETMVAFLNSQHRIVTTIGM